VLPFLPSQGRKRRSSETGAFPCLALLRPSRTRDHRANEGAGRTRRAGGVEIDRTSEASYF
jgi:hypothetical protein